jgi:hypothetical protein
VFSNATISSGVKKQKNNASANGRTPQFNIKNLKLKIFLAFKAQSLRDKKGKPYFVSIKAKP